MTRGAQHARASYREVLGVGEFRALLISQGLSLVGDQVARIALALLVFERTGSPFATAATYAASYFTWLFGGPLLSVVSDRRDRRSVMVLCDIARAALIAVLLVPAPPLWLVFAVLIGVGLLAPPFDSARSASLAEVLDGERYVVGNALLSLVAQGGQVLGFLTGGALVALLDVRGALGLDVLTFLVSAAALVIGLRARPPAPRTSTSSYLQDARDGVAAVSASPRMRQMLLFGLIGMATVIVPEGLAVSLAAKLDGGPVAAGALTASIPLGFLIGSLLVLRAPLDRREALLGPLAASSAVLLALTPLLTDLRLVFVVWTLAGIGSALQIVAGAAFVQAAPSHVRARAYGVAGTALMGVQGVALLLSGAVADAAGPAAAVAGSSVVALVVLGLGLRTALRAPERVLKESAT